MMIDKQKFMAICLTLSTVGGSAALAQAIPQDPVSKAAVRVQQEAASGQISPKQASQIEGQLWQLKSEEQQDMAHHGGYLTPQDNQRLWSQIHSIEGGNNFDGNNWHSSPRHSSLLSNVINRGGTPNSPGQYQPGYNQAYNNGYNGYNQGYAPGYNPGYQNAPNSGSGSKFTQAAGILQNLLHH